MIAVDYHLSMIQFAATLHRPKREDGSKAVTWTFLKLPKKSSEKLPSRAMVSVEGTFNDHPFQTTLQPDGAGGHWLRVERKLRVDSGAAVGESVKVKITPMTEELEPKVPTDLRKALAAAQSAKAVWSDITPLARRDWIQWITSGKRAETRAIRIDKAIDMLTNGKRRPCCFDRTGMYDKSLSCPEAEDE